MNFVDGAPNIASPMNYIRTEGGASPLLDKSAENRQDHDFDNAKY